MLKFFLSLKYLRKTKLILLSIAAVALSLSLLIVTDSIFTFLLRDLMQSRTLYSGDLHLDTKFLPKYNLLIDRIQTIPEVNWAAPGYEAGGLIRLAKGNVREAQIYAIDPIRLEKDYDLRKNLLRQSSLALTPAFEHPASPNEPGAWIGISLIAEPNQKTGQYDLEQAKKLIGRKAILITSGEKLSTDKKTGKTRRTGTRRLLKFTISDIYHSGIYFEDNTLFLPYETLFRLKNPPENELTAPHLIISAKQNTEIDSLIPKVETAWEKFCHQDIDLTKAKDPNKYIKASIWTRNEALDRYFSDAKKQMSVLFFIFSLICSVTILLILCTFYVIALTRQKDIAILKSCGTGLTSLSSVFLSLAGFIGLLGSAIGILLAVAIMTNTNTINQWSRDVLGLGFWPGDMIGLEKIPTDINWPAVWYLVPAAVIACLLGAVIPAALAAKTEPVKILRYE